MSATLVNENDLTKTEIAEFAADYEDFIAINDEKVYRASEFDSKVLGKDWVQQQRTAFWDEFGTDRFVPVWNFEEGHSALHALAQRYDNVGIPGNAIEEDKALASYTRALTSQFGTTFHALGSMKPDNLRQVNFETASTLAWISPMMRGETIIWDGTKLMRYPKRMKDQARRRYKSVIEKADLDYNLIMGDDSNEVTRLAIWSYLQLEDHINKKSTPLLSDNSVHMDDPGNAETGWVEPVNKGSDMRKLYDKTNTRDASEMGILPGFSMGVKTIIDKDSAGRDIIVDAPILGSSSQSLRQCNTCFVANNCPAFKPEASCAFSLPVEVKTKDQLKALLNAIIEIQGSRVAFMRFAEEMNGGYADPNTSQEIDRLFKIVKQLKELEENKEFVRMTVERQTSGGVMSALFGDRASSLKDLPNEGLKEIDVTNILSENLEN
jgi:hypothetical protein